MKVHRKQFGWRIAVAVLAIVGWLRVAPSFAQTQLPDDQPETVLVTFHVQPGHEDEMKKVLADAWQAYTRLDMVLPQPHVILQGSENGRPYFVEILTWQNHDIPDHMPAEVQEIWKHMGAICEKRGDKPPIDGGEVRLIVPSAK
ncbi:MAG TPA: hypothetical protein VGR81_09985 [Candidatus Acidoferrales bacterium]|nr:hypothetical protein [Candidatus Acidoferrales bacterium]